MQRQAHDLGKVEQGVFLRGDAIIVRKNGAERQIMTTEDIRLPGVHNVENYMAAIAAVDGLVSDEVIVKFAREFNGVEHRIELVRTYHGVRFYNDSIASSPSRTIAGLRSFKEKVILIAGGYDKHIPFDVLGPEIVKLHIKDFKIERGAKNDGAFVRLGEGSIDWKRVRRAIHAVGYNGWVSIEERGWTDAEYSGIMDRFFAGGL